MVNECEAEAEVDTPTHPLLQKAKQKYGCKMLKKSKNPGQAYL